MLAKVMTIKGALAPSALRIISESNTTVRVSFGNHGLGKMLLGSNIKKDTIIEIDSAIKVLSGYQSAQRFMKKLTEFIQSEEISGWNLYGTIMIAMETEDDPVMIRATVRDGKVTYQNARIVWEKEEVFQP